MSKPVATKGLMLSEVSFRHAKRIRSHSPKTHQSDSDYTDEEVPLLERNEYDGYEPTVRRLRNKPPPSLGHVRSAAVDFSKNFAREIDHAIKKEQVSCSVDLHLMLCRVVWAYNIAQQRIARHVTFGTPHPVIHQRVKAAAPKAGLKDADADWDIVDTDELGVSKDDIRGMYTLWNR
jgi:hypothetical protein